MFGLIFVSDGQNEGLLIMALIFIAQFALLLCGIVSVCYTCAYARHFQMRTIVSHEVLMSYVNLPALDTPLLSSLFWQPISYASLHRPISNTEQLVVSF